MKKELVQAATCFCVLMACGLVWARALADGDAIWALIFNWLGFAVGLNMCWHIAAAVKAAGRPRRPRRRTADEWQVLISNLYKQD